MYKIEIFPKNDTFLDDLMIFLFEKSAQFKRDFFIDNILNDTTALYEKINFFGDNKRIKLENVFGSTFQTYHRSNENIYAISHLINYIEFENDSIYGIIEPSEYGDIINFELGILRPVYYTSEVDKKTKIATFDIDFNITNNAA